MKRIIPQPQLTSLHLARAFVDSHYDQPITLEHISGAAGFSPYHFIRLFHSAYRQTPHQYLMQRRIEKAKELLRATDLPIIEICYQVGFESLGSFSTLFRRVTGLPPSAYRARSSAAQMISHIPLCHRLMLGLENS